MCRPPQIRPAMNVYNTDTDLLSEGLAVTRKFRILLVKNRCVSESADLATFALWFRVKRG